MEAMRWEDRPKLRAPVLIAAFEGWNDAGDAATSAARYLARAWAARRFATIDPEEFYDFTTTRPQVRLVDGITRTIEWPLNELSAASLPGRGHDVVLLRRRAAAQVAHVLRQRSSTWPRSSASSWS